MEEAGNVVSGQTVKSLEYHGKDVSAVFEDFETLEQPVHPFFSKSHCGSAERRVGKLKSKGQKQKYGTIILNPKRGSGREEQRDMSIREGKSTGS